MDYWMTDDDVDYDMFTLSEFTDGKKYKPLRPKNPNQKPNKTSPIPIKSIYDFEDDLGLDEAEKKKIAEKQLISSIGRGYVERKFGAVNQSEMVMSQRVLDQTARDIREIAPMGCSNEIIEAAFKKPSVVNSPRKPPLAEFRFSPSSDVTNGAIPKKPTEPSVFIPSTSTLNDLPAELIEYDITAPKLNLNDKNEFPCL